MGDARQGQDWTGVLWSVTCLLEGLGLPFWVISGVFPVSLSGLLQEEGWEGAALFVWVEDVEVLILL